MGLAPPTGAYTRVSNPHRFFLWFAGIFWMRLLAAGIVSLFSLVTSCCRSQICPLRPLLELAVVEIKEVESNVTAPSDSVDSSSLRHKLNRFRDKRVHYESRTPKGAHTESRAQHCILNRRLYLGF